MKQEVAETVTMQVTVRVRYSGKAGKNKALQDLKRQLQRGAVGVYSSDSFGIATVKKVELVRVSPNTNPAQGA